MNLDELRILIRYGESWVLAITPFNWDLKPSKAKIHDVKSYSFLCFELQVSK